jgi:murein DD-endopeptidase MepM/ murein hydrolase activator NlpD
LINEILLAGYRLYEAPPTSTNQNAGVFPIQGYDYSSRSSAYGVRYHPIDKITKPHSGIDFAAPSNTPLAAMYSGTVINIKYDDEYGHTIKIASLVEGRAIEYLYAHMINESHLSIGSYISAGDRVGAVGETGKSAGPHVHIEVWDDGKRVNPDQNYTVRIIYPENGNVPYNSYPYNSARPYYGYIPLR